MAGQGKLDLSDELLVRLKRLYRFLAPDEDNPLTLDVLEAVHGLQIKNILKDFLKIAAVRQAEERERIIENTVATSGGAPWAEKMKQAGQAAQALSRMASPSRRSREEALRYRACPGLMLIEARTAFNPNPNPAPL